MKQESTKSCTDSNVQNSTNTDQSRPTLLNNRTTNKSIQNNENVQQNHVNWKWIIIDKFKFNISIPCIIRQSDHVNELVSVRIVEKVILSKFEPSLSEEAKKFGVLTTYYCTADEIFTLNDINENHVDQLYGNEKFKIESDVLVSLEDFLKFFEIIQRTVPLKNNSVENIQNKTKQFVYNSNRQFRMSDHGIATNAYHQFYSNNLNHQLIQRLPNFSHNNNNNNNNNYIYPNINNNKANYFFNYPQANIANQSRLACFQSNQVNPVQHQVVQFTQMQRPTLPVIPITSINQINNLRNTNHNLMENLNYYHPPAINFHTQHNPPITVTLPNANIRNLTPPLTPLANIISNLATDVNKSTDLEKVKEEVKKNQLDTSEEIFLIDDDQSSTIGNIQVERSTNDIEHDIDFNDETYGFLQLNDKILLYIDVQDSFYRYNRNLPKCCKHVLLAHLMKNFDINCANDLKKNLKIKMFDNNSRIRSLINWFNTNRAPMSLDLVKDEKIELINIMQFQNLYAKEAIFFKNLHYFNQPGIDYYAEYKKILTMNGGFVCVPVERNKHNIRPFVRLADQLLVSSNFAEIVCKSIDLNQCQIEAEKVNFDLRKDSKLIEQINEFYRLQVFYFSLETSKDGFRKKNTLFYNLNNFLNLFPKNFKILCEFNSDFPKSWLYDLDRYSLELVNTNTVDKRKILSSSSDDNTQNSVFMSPQSYDQPVETISMAILNDKNSFEFTQEDFKNKPRLRSYSETSVLLKFSNKFRKKEKQFIKYKYLFKKRNSCTAIQFLKSDFTVAKDDLLKNQVLSYMNKILEKKNIEKKLNKTYNVQKESNIQIKQEKNEPNTTDLSIQPSTSNSLQTIPNIINEEDNIEPLTIELLKKSINGKKKSKGSSSHCPFLIDSPNSTVKKQTKRKKSKCMDEFKKKARMTLDYEEIKKDLNFIVPDDRITPLKENEHFNFLPKKNQEAKNLSLLKQNKNDLYSTDSADEKSSIKNFNVCFNAKVVVDKIDIQKYLQRINQFKQVKNEKINRCKIKSTEKILVKSCITKNLVDFKLNEENLKKKNTNKTLRIESDDEELPRL